METDFSIEFDRFVSWARYLYWADLQRRRFTPYHSDVVSPDDEDPEWHLVAVSAQWFASMWVVIEGWQHLGYRDKVVDGLLNDYPEYCSLLKRFRNTVYHYQPTVFDQRVMDFSAEGSGPIITWIFALYLEFQRFLWERPEKFKGTKEQKLELRQILRDVIGWMPTDIIPAMKQSTGDLRKQAMQMMESYGDTTSLAAQELLAALDHGQTIADGLPDTPILDCLKQIKGQTSLESKTD